MKNDPVRKNRAEHNIAIVLSAGRGSRMHTETAKQYLDLCGCPVIAWSLRAFEQFDGIDDVILVSAADDIEYCRSEIVGRYGFSKVRSIVPGGAERFLSVWEGLKEAKRFLSMRNDPAAENRRKLSAGPEENARDDQTGSYVFIHDGARPLVDRGILVRTLEDVRRYGACTAAMPVKDTIKISDENGFALRTPDRSFLWQIQTPQVFSFFLAYRAYQELIRKGDADVTDDAMVVERETSVSVKLTEGSWQNIKITTQEDLGIAKMFLEGRERAILFS